MTASKKISVTIEAVINANAEKVWTLWTLPEHIRQWNHASPDWYSPKAANDLRPGGKFNYRMEARDGSMGFDFEGIYDAVTPGRFIEYTMGDGRKAQVIFTAADNQTHIKETFEAETENPVELQKAGWQAILDNFKQYAETNGELSNKSK